jgi:hypothetical protein
MNWAPVLGPTQRETALAIVRAIADDLRAHFTVPAHVTPSESWSLAEGRAGVALFFAYLGRALGDEHASAFAARLVEQALEAAAGRVVLENLFSGFGGVAWTLAHFDGWLFDLSDGDPADAVDAALLDLVTTAPWLGEYDLLAGLAGISVYALERLPRPGATEVLSQVVARLSQLVEQDPRCPVWWTPAERLPPVIRERHPTGAWNLGVAHGAPGVVGSLALASAVGVDSARPLAERAVNWILGQQLPAEVGYGFPSFVSPATKDASSRLAWCYGEPGIAGVLLAAGQQAGVPTWEADAVAIAERAACRPRAGSGVVDASICHGSAGLAHVFNRVYQATGSLVCRAAAERWLDEVFQAWRPGIGPGLLTGAAGIGLVLLAACTPLEPCWDRLFVLS